MPDGTATSVATDDGAAEKGDQKSEPFLKTATSTFKSPDDAVKGFDEAQKSLRNRESEVDSLKKEVDSLKQDQKEASVLEKLADKLGVDGNQSQEDREETLSKIREEISIDPGKAVDYMTDTLSAVDRDYHAKLQEQENRINRAMQEGLEKLQAQADEVRISADPIIVHHGDKVATAMEEFNVDRTTAMKIVSKEVGPIDSDSEAPPPNSGTSRRTGSLAQSKVSGDMMAELEAQWSLTANEKEALSSGKGWRDS